MTNRNKRRGDEEERWVRDYLRTNGFPTCERTRAGYERDGGDLHLDPIVGVGPRVIAQVKNTQALNWTDWIPALQQQIEQARAQVGFLAIRRTLPNRRVLRLAVMPLDKFVDLLTAAGYGTPTSDDPWPDYQPVTELNPEEIP